MMSKLLRKRAAIFIILFILAVSVRFLTMQFVRAHLTDAAWFQFGSYQLFEKRALNILSGSEPAFWINDPSRTDVVQYPPAFSWWVALIYRSSGNHSAYSVQRVQWVIDLVLSLFLITAITVSAFGWRAALAAGFLCALSPLLAMYGGWPSADAPTAWFVLGSTWLLLIAVKRSSLGWAVGAGLLLGIACWVRMNPLYLALFIGVAVILFVQSSLKRRLALAAGFVGATAVVISPIIYRNYVVFPDFTPTGGTVGVNLWEGLGEAELGRQHGFSVNDAEMIERERHQMDLPPDYPVDAFWPDGIRRDQQRVRESLVFIKQHPVWFGAVMVRRMWAMLKVFGDPLPYSGSAGINVTSEKCLPPQHKGGVISLLVNLLGMVQSVVRYLLLPLAACGIWLGVRGKRMISALLLTVIFYYLVPGTVGHAEFRYMLPMHGLIIVFGGLGFATLSAMLRKRVAKLSTDWKGTVAVG